MFFGKVREPVLSIVKEILEDPSKHKLSLINDNHICIYFRNDLSWRLSIAHEGFWMWRGDTAAWMTSSEARYVYNSLRHLYDDDKLTRSGWMRKVKEKNNANVQ